MSLHVFLYKMEDNSTYLTACKKDSYSYEDVPPKMQKAVHILVINMYEYTYMHTLIHSNDY